MGIDLDAQVFTRAFEKLGRVKRAVVDPETNEVTDLVIGTGGFLRRDVLLPIAEIDRAARQGELILLHLTRDDVEKLPSYRPTNYVSLGAGRSAAGRHVLDPRCDVVCPTPSAGGGVAVPIAWSPTPDPASAAPSVGRGARVVDRDGEDIGVVDDVGLDPTTGALRGFVVRLGGALRTRLGGGDTTVVGVE
jgi:sporulation protein YlmC with PRC-barrel domain